MTKYITLGVEKWKVFCKEVKLRKEIANSDDYKMMFMTGFMQGVLTMVEEENELDD